MKSRPGIILALFAAFLFSLGRLGAAAAEKDSPDTNWWSLRPLSKPVIPAGETNPIDAFISRRLREEKVSPAPEADRRTLIRRLYFDLHGLPPTPGDVERFVQGRNPNAYEELVDRLLASPRYGERWARHWLDAIHYADTHGFEHDLIRTNAWVYRDYVIDALNRDVPWDRFIREQLAADVFFPDEPALTAAMGFMAAGPWDHSTAQTAPKTSDYLDRDDLVTQTMSTFASVTVHCARCHDHKFEPITQEDYYGLQAVFAGVGKGDVEFDADVKIARERRRWKELIAAADRKDAQQLSTPENEALVTEWMNARGPEATWEIDGGDSFVTASAAHLERLDDGSFIAKGPRPETDVYTVSLSAWNLKITAVRLELFADPAFPKNGPGRTDNGNLHLSEFEIQVFDPRATASRKIEIARAVADFNQEGWTISHAVDGNEKTAWGIFPRVGENHIAIFYLKEPLALTNGARVNVLLKQLHGGGHVVGKFRVATTADDPTRARVLPSEVAEALRTNTRTPALAAFALREIAEKRLIKLGAPSMVFAAARDFAAVVQGFSYQPWPEPKIVNILKRGDITKPGAVAKLGAIAAIPVSFQMDGSSESARRAALANWLADKNNPLTWRSIVNRVWHHHFGRGLVDSLNDFGHMGGLPTHPELLDYLSAEFRDSGASLKSLHRLIVTSQAYRRSTQVNEVGSACDADNLLLWHAKARRLDAESFRDAVLVVSGRLDPAMHGPGVQQFKLGKPIQLTPTVDYDAFDWSAPGANRRSVYRFIFRGLQDPFMEALDFPDAAQLAPSRPFSASPLQSLALLNNDFVLYHSEAFARRLKAMPGDPIQNAFRLAFQRGPTETELRDFSAYAEKHGLPAMCRIIFNSNEFLFVN